MVVGTFGKNGDSSAKISKRKKCPGNMSCFQNNSVSMNK